MVKKPEEDTSKSDILLGKTNKDNIPSKKLVCVGTISFEEGKIKVSVDKESNPECAKKLSDYLIQQNKDLVFEINSKDRIKKE